MENLEIKINAKLYSEKDIFKVIDILSNKYKIKFNNKVDDFYILEVLITNWQKASTSIETIFFEHLNNQKIRDIIYNETHEIREMIISKALFETEAYDDNADYFDINEYKEEDNYLLDIYNIALSYDNWIEKDGTK